MVPETHIVHATATFSELGIAAASVLLADLPKWRRLAGADQTDPIALNDLVVTAKRLGGLACQVVKIIAAIPSVLNAIIFIAPFLSVGLGVYALIGISFYPPLLLDSVLTSWMATESATLDVVYWVMGFCSLLVAMFAAVMEQSRAKVVRAAQESTATDF